jgi:hypothetical protein
VRGLSNHYQWLYDAADYFDRWRKTTIVFASLHTKATPPAASMKLWQYEWDNVKRVSLRYSRDPQHYQERKSLNASERQALELFFDGIAAKATDRSWKVSIIVHPDDAEIYANLARRAPALEDLDPRRANALAICKTKAFDCQDISRLIYARILVEGRNAYFTDDRHFSPFGTAIVADHFASLIH